MLKHGRNIIVDHMTFPNILIRYWLFPHCILFTFLILNYVVQVCHGSTDSHVVRKIVVITTRLLSDAHRYILRCLTTLQNINYCIIYTSVSEVFILVLSETYNFFVFHSLFMYIRFKGVQLCKHISCLIMYPQACKSIHYNISRLTF